jgi:hypothetical protein
MVLSRILHDLYILTKYKYIQMNILCCSLDPNTKFPSIFGPTFDLFAFNFLQVDC